MKLLYTHNSPYARRVRVALREADLLAGVEEVDLHPREQHLETLLAHGAAGKVPVLVTDEGYSLCESLVIVQYLDRVCGAGLYPPGGAALARCLAVEGLASALMDSLFVRSREHRRDAAERSQRVVDLERERAARLYGALEAAAEEFGDPLHMDALTVACSLGYADGRHADDAWRNACPRLCDWYASVCERPSMIQTQPSFRRAIAGDSTRAQR